MPVYGWVDTVSVSDDEWRNMPSDERTLELYLLAAYEQCLEYVPHDADGLPVVPDPVPASWRLAQIMQARALFNSVIAGQGEPSDTFGQGPAQVSVFPMDWTVRLLLRPKRLFGW